MGFQKKVMSFQKEQQEIVKELADKEAELLRPVEDKIAAAIDAIAKKRSLDLVVRAEAAVFAKPASTAFFRASNACCFCCFSNSFSFRLKSAFALLTSIAFFLASSSTRFCPSVLSRFGLVSCLVIS